MLRRSLFCLFWFAIFWVALMTVGAGIAGSYAGSHASQKDTNFQQGFVHGYQAGAVAGARFRQQYGLWIVAGAAVLAVAGTVSQVLPGTKR
jgi:hypothetical protein